MALWSIPSRFSQTLVKKPFHAISTLGPVRRVAAFFALLGLLTLTSCGEDKDSPQAIMKEQTRIFNEMAGIVSEVAEKGDQNGAAQKITVLAEELKQLKIKMSDVLIERKEEDLAAITSQPEFLEANAAFQEAQTKLFQSGRNTHELAKALVAHHNPAPLVGEGKTE